MPEQQATCVTFVAYRSANADSDPSSDSTIPAGSYAGLGNDAVRSSNERKGGGVCCGVCATVE
jgi:hypothetical protein